MNYKRSEKIKNYLCLPIIFLLSINVVFSQIKAKTDDGKVVVLNKNGTWHYQNFRLHKLELPKTNADNITHHKGFSLQYSEEHEQPLWVAYELTKSETKNKFKRTNKFLQDPKISSKTANNKDYSKSGYDRGHLAPASDMGWSKQTMAESFYYSNISPQRPGFNRGIWKKLETQVRAWAKEYKAIYVATGPILNNHSKAIGKNKVSVPAAFYKVILLVDDNGESKAIGFVMKNARSKSLVKSFATSVDEVEQQTGLDFFYHLPNYLEEKVESGLCLNCWSWKSRK
jgi:endonuclease G